MSILHKDKRPEDEYEWENYDCVDCGRNTFPGWPPPELAKHLMSQNKKFDAALTAECEVYMVTTAVWKKAGMDEFGGCLCIDCLEKRLGRELKPKDFLQGHAFNAPHAPGTPKLLDRRGNYSPPD